MNQVQFAKFLSVGEASVKRWETWLVQDRSSDHLIRLKCKDIFEHEEVRSVMTAPPPNQLT